jgi:hypothetical protein
VSLDILYGLDCGPWVLQRVPVMRSAGPNVGIAIGNGKSIIAACLYYDYDGNNMQMAIAADSPRWASRRTIKALLSYPFRDVGAGRVTCIIERTNLPSIRLCEGIGFKREGLLRRVYRNGSDGWVYGLLVEEAERWIGKIEVKYAAAA